MTKLFLLLTVCMLGFSTIAFCQCPPEGGDQTGGHGSGGDSSGGDSPIDDFIEWIIRRVHSQDPNDILGPSGYQDKKWVAAKDKLSFRIRFENNHEFATAPVHSIFIRQAVDPKININTLRLGGFGFGSYTFQVPDNSSFYNTRLDVRDSLGLFVDVIAGIDLTKNEIFWSFKCIDPLTGRTPENALVGILPVNDSAINRFNDTLQKPGEGYVTYLINARAGVVTGDTVAAKAIIVFDTNEEIPTNTWVNSIDAVAPVSKALGATPKKDTLTINWSGEDDAGGTGVKEYALFVSENNSAFTLFKDKLTGSSAPFVGTPGVTYGFFTLATDQVGNTEALKKNAEVTGKLETCPEEICNGVDDDCDSLVDEGFTVTWYRDEDGDGYGTVAIKLAGTICVQPQGYVRDSTDCNDSNRTVHPGAVEVCDGLDNNCDGQVDEGLTQITYYQDIDKDGYGSAVTTTSCSATPPAGYVSTTGDCNDNDAAIHPGAVEICNNNKDDDCDGQVDEGCNIITWYRDNDHDGYGDPGYSTTAPTQPDGFVTQAGDCNDNDPLVHPGATEICNGKDDNCNGEADETCSERTFYMDVDGDGYGRDNAKVVAAKAPPGYVSLGGDCKDYDPKVYPGAPEIANGYDDNCNGLVDEGLPMLTYYMDVDGDGFGRNEGAKQSAIPLAGHVLVGGDCKDYDPKVYPGAPEIANGYDDNCNGQIDEGLPIITYYLDVDGDGFGRSEGTKKSAIPLAGYVLVSGDCKDWDPAVYPGASEAMNGRDDNCNGLIDEVTIVFTNARAKTAQALPEQADSLQQFSILAYPVPSYTAFNIYIKGTDMKEKVKVSVYDHMGRLVEVRDQLSVGKVISIGGKYAKGLYIVEARQGKQVKAIKVVKI